MKENKTEEKKACEMLAKAKAKMAKRSAMNKFMKTRLPVILLAVVGLSIISGCADEETIYRAKSRQAVLSETTGVNLGLSDLLYVEAQSERDPLVREFLYKTVKEEYKDSAWFKRQFSLAYARGFLSYQFRSYFYFDGVSALTYNTAYLFSVPNKIVMSFFCADGVLGFAWNILQLLLGMVAALVGVVAATLLGAICHPFETLANLTAGIFYFGPGWWRYVFHTNFLASLWDLIFGGIVYPLWQFLTFWL